MCVCVGSAAPNPTPPLLADTILYMNHLCVCVCVLSYLENRSRREESYELGNEGRGHRKEQGPAALHLRGALVPVLFDHLRLVHQGEAVRLGFGFCCCRLRVCVVSQSVAPSPPKNLHPTHINTKT